jgi:hypothetical protein
MRTSSTRRAARILAGIALMAASTAACDRSPTRSDHADVAAVRLTVGAQVVTVTSTGAQTGALALPVGTHAVAVAWLDASGGVVTDLGSGKSLMVVPGAGITDVSFAASGNFAGQMTLAGSGARTVVVRLMHGNHADFSQTVAFTVQ